MKIFLDFIGTVVDNSVTTRTNFGCCEVIYALQKAGHELVWNTESSKDKVDGWFEHSWAFFTNRGTEENLELEPIRWTGNKIQPDAFIIEEAICAEMLFIDDHSIGIPLKDNFEMNGYIVDWYRLGDTLKKHGLYENNKG